MARASRQHRTSDFRRTLSKSSGFLRLNWNFLPQHKPAFGDKGMLTLPPPPKAKPSPKKPRPSPEAEAAEKAKGGSDEKKEVIDASKSIVGDFLSHEQLEKVWGPDKCVDEVQFGMKCVGIPGNRRKLHTMDVDEKQYATHEHMVSS